MPLTVVKRLFSNTRIEHMRVGKPASSIRVATPAADGANHLLARVMGNVRCVNITNKGNEIAGEIYRFKTFRHPNCNHLDFIFYADVQAANETKSISVQCGSGAIVKAESVQNPGIFGGFIRIRAPWSSVDSGLEEVTIETNSYTSIMSMTVLDAPRATVDVSTDDCVAMLPDDAGYSDTGLMEGRIIGNSDDAGPSGIIDSVNKSWTHYRRQCIAQVNSVSAAASLSASSGWTTVYTETDTHSHHLSREYEDGDSTKPYICDCFSWMDGSADYYRIRIVTAHGLVSTGVLSNTSATWVKEMSGLQFMCSAQDTYTVQMMISGSSGKCYLQHYSICQQEGED